MRVYEFLGPHWLTEKEKFAWSRIWLKVGFKMDFFRRSGHHKARPVSAVVSGKVFKLWAVPLAYHLWVAINYIAGNVGYLLGINLMFDQLTEGELSDQGSGGKHQAMAGILEAVVLLRTFEEASVDLQLWSWLLLHPLHLLAGCSLSPSEWKHMPGMRQDKGLVDETGRYFNDSPWSIPAWREVLLWFCNRKTVYAAC